MSISRVEVGRAVDKRAPLFQAILSITILKDLSSRGFFQDRKRYQFSP
jgi:hypothetical protein